MATKKVEEEQTLVTPPVKKYGKNTFITAEEYLSDRELLKVLLTNGEKYSKDEVKIIVANYKKKEVN